MFLPRLPFSRRSLAALLALGLALSASRQAMADSLQTQFLGVSTIQVSDGETSLLSDGFFSRPSVLRLVMPIQPNEARIDMALAKGQLGKQAALLVAHSHHDHAMDVGLVARKTGAQVVGTSSVKAIALGAGLPAAQTRAVSGGEVLRFGRFEVDVIASPHSPDPVFPGKIASPLKTPASLIRYKEGGNLSFLLRHEKGNVLIHASANYVRGMYAGKRADVVFLGIGLLGKQNDDFIKAYWQEVVRATGAKVVVPIHWDDFTRSLDEPLKKTAWPLDKVDAALKAIEALAKADGVALRMMQQFERMPVSSPR